MRKAMAWLLLVCLSACLCLSPVSLAEPSPLPPTSSVPLEVPPRPIQVKIEGLVTSTYTSVPGEMRVDGAAISVTVATVVSPVGTVPKLGDRVSVNALVEGTLFIARSVRIMIDGATVQETEFRGIIEAASEEYGVLQDDESFMVTISGLQVTVPKALPPCPVPRAPQVGDYAHVRGFLEAGGAIRATYFCAYDPADLARRFEYEGILRSLSQERPGIWIIGNVAGRVDETTEIVGTPVLGAAAEVRGRHLDDGTWNFDYVKIATTSPYVRIQGVIQEAELQRRFGFVDGYLIVNDRIVLLGRRTLLDESGGRAAPGMWADIMALPLGEQGLDAVRVRVTRPG